MSEHLKYVGYSVVFEEIPDEVTLAINISGCPHRCPGCHSPYLWKSRGMEIYKDLHDLLHGYEKLVSCTCFMGGDQNMAELAQLAAQVRAAGLKVALYSGLPTMEQLKPVWDNFDYIKVGDYREALGGLASPTTNQRLYKKEPDNTWSDITTRFWKKVPI